MSPSAPSPSSRLEFLTEKAKEDLAQRLHLLIAQINLVETRAVTWSDSSLGCPQKGMFYTQVLTDGYLIRLEVDGTQYEYHADQNNYVFLCENPHPPVPGLPGDR